MTGADPLSFAMEALAARGALVEPTAGGALAVLPPPVATALRVPEELHMALDGAGPGVLSCGYGSPLLEMLIREAHAATPVTWARLEERAPAPATALAAAGRLLLRNGLLDVLDAMVSEAVYAAAFFSVVAEADDRHETTVSTTVDLETGGEPEPAFADRLDPLGAGRRLSPGSRCPVRGNLDRLADRARLLAPDALQGFVAAVARRKARDAERLADYFDGLVAAARAPRRAVPPEAVAAKVEHLEAERRQKLRDLDGRFTVRAEIAPAALLFVAVPVMRVRVRLRRRKGERQVDLQVPPGSRMPDRLACATCPRTTWAPVACDERLHLLCERCAPSASGRPRCAACGRG